MANPFEQFKQAANPFAAFAKKEDDRKVIAETQDGGKVYQLAGGQLAFASPGYSTNDQDAIKRILDGAKPIDEVQAQTDQMTLAQHPVAARVQEFNQGVPLIGEWLDNAVGLVSPTAGKAMQQMSDAMERQNPYESAALNIAGGVGYTIPMVAAGAGQKAADWVAKGSSAVSRALRGAAVAAPSGAVEGASSLAGRADDGSRLEGAGTGLVLGAGLGAVMGSLAPLLGEGTASLARRVKKLDVGAIADEFGLSAPAARIVKQHLLNDDLDAAQKALARGGNDAMLASAGPSTRQLLDTAMSEGGQALSIGRDRVGAATSAAGARLSNTIDDILGTADGGIKGAAKAAAQKTAPARKAAYDFAYSQPTPTTGPVAQKIDDVLARVPSSQLRAALEEAQNEMIFDGYTNQNIMAKIAQDGSVSFSQPLSVLQLDYLAKGLANVADAGKDSITGAMKRPASRASSLAGDLRDALKDGVPGYSTALKLGGDNIKTRNALTMGRELLNDATRVEDVRNFVKGLPDDARAALKKGFRENLDAVMGRARATLADLENGALDFETGINTAAEAVAAVRNLTSRNNIVKSRFALGSDANRLFSEIEKMADALVLRAAVAKGSATAIRRAGQQQIADEVAPGLIRQTLGNAGDPLTAGRGVTQALAGTDARTTNAVRQEYLAEIADTLTRLKGPDAQRALDAVRRAMAGQPLKDAEAQLIGRVVAGSAAVGGYRTAMQPLMPQ